MKNSKRFAQNTQALCCGWSGIMKKKDKMRWGQDRHSLIGTLNQRGSGNRRACLVFESHQATTILTMGKHEWIWKIYAEQPQDYLLHGARKPDNIAIKLHDYWVSWSVRAHSNSLWMHGPEPTLPSSKDKVESQSSSNSRRRLLVKAGSELVHINEVHIYVFQGYWLRPCTLMSHVWAGLRDPLCFWSIWI